MTYLSRLVLNLRAGDDSFITHSELNYRQLNEKLFFIFDGVGFVSMGLFIKYHHGYPQNLWIRSYAEFFQLNDQLVWLRLTSTRPCLLMLLLIASRSDNVMETDIMTKIATIIRI